MCLLITQMPHVPNHSMITVAYDYLLSFPSPNFFSCPLKAPLPAWSTFLFLYLQTGFSAYYSFPSEHVL